LFHICEEAGKFWVIFPPHNQHSFETFKNHDPSSIVMILWAFFLMYIYFKKELIAWYLSNLLF
jgi:hypothetical protein